MKRIFCFIVSVGIFPSLFASVVNAQVSEKVPRFEPAPCPFASREMRAEVKLECGFLVVAQDRSKPAGRTFRLAVAIFRSKAPSNRPPLVFLHGGPSGPGALSGGEMRVAPDWVVAAKSDAIVYDQRGAGLSEPKLCPDLTSSSDEVRNLRVDAERQAIFNENARRCVASLRKNNIDPDALSSESNAADLIDLRKTLGYKTWNMIGVSYGGRLAQEAMRRDPNGVRSVVMHSPAIVGGGAELEKALSFQSVLDRLFAACRKDAACAVTYPNFEKEFYEVYEELNRDPIYVPVERVDGSVKVLFDGVRLLRNVHNSFSRVAGYLPLLVNELKRGDRGNAARFLIGSGGSGSASGNMLTNIVGCYDAYGSAYLKALVDVSNRVRPQFRIFLNDLQECPIYQSRFASEADRLPVRSDIPALVLTTEFDDRTPTSHGLRIAGALKNAHHFELPGQFHGHPPVGCPGTIILQFLMDPSRKPDDSCLASMPPLSFELKLLNAPNLTLRIFGRTSTGANFLGQWEAFFPNAPPSGATFELVADGKTLSGSVKLAVLVVPIFDGMIDGDSIRFRAKSPDGDRTITFIGNLDNDEINFTRAVEIRPGGARGGSFVFGGSGAPAFKATRIK